MNVRALVTHPVSAILEIGFGILSGAVAGCAWNAKLFDTERARMAMQWMNAASGAAPDLSMPIYPSALLLGVAALIAGIVVAALVIVLLAWVWEFLLARVRELSAAARGK